MTTWLLVTTYPAGSTRKPLPEPASISMPSEGSLKTPTASMRTTACWTSSRLATGLGAAPSRCRWGAGTAALAAVGEASSSKAKSETASERRCQNCCRNIHCSLSFPGRRVQPAQTLRPMLLPQRGRGFFFILANLGELCNPVFHSLPTRPCESQAPRWGGAGCQSSARQGPLLAAGTGRAALSP